MVYKILYINYTPFISYFQPFLLLYAKYIYFIRPHEANCAFIPHASMGDFPHIFLTVPFSWHSLQYDYCTIFYRAFQELFVSSPFSYRSDDEKEYRSPLVEDFRQQHTIPAYNRDLETSNLQEISYKPLSHMLYRNNPVAHHRPRPHQ